MALIDGTHSHYRFDEIDGTRFDAHASYDLVEVGGFVPSDTGKIGLSADFSPVVATLENASGDYYFAHSFTISTWFMRESRGGIRRFLSRWGGAASTRNWRIAQNASNVIFEANAVGFGLAQLIAAGSLGAVGSWNLAVAWYDYDGSMIYLQVNNGPIESTAFIGPAGSSDPAVLQIGLDFLGRIDSTWFWQRVLSPAERGELWNNGDGVDYPGAGPTGSARFPRQMNAGAIDYDALTAI